MSQGMAPGPSRGAWAATKFVGGIMAASTAIVGAGAYSDAHWGTSLTDHSSTQSTRHQVHHLSPQQFGNHTTIDPLDGR